MRRVDSSEHDMHGGRRLAAVGRGHVPEDLGRVRAAANMRRVRREIGGAGLLVARVAVEGGGNDNADVAWRERQVDERNEVLVVLRLGEHRLGQEHIHPERVHQAADDVAALVVDIIQGRELVAEQHVQLLAQLGAPVLFSRLKLRVSKGFTYISRMRVSLCV